MSNLAYRQLESVEPSLVFRANQSCPLGCRSGKIKLCETYGSGRFESELFTIWQCEHCGLGFTDPIPTEETSHLLYETRESNDFQPNDSKLVSTLKALAARRDARKFCRDADRRGRILDYGCGNGAFVRAIQQVLPEAHVLGTDQHPTAPSLLNGQTYLPYSRLADEKFDFILCRHVLEHTYGPAGFLRLLRSMLSPNGILAIEVPSLETAVKNLFGKRWDGYYAPFHPLHFTRKSLATVVRATGLTVIREGSAEMPKMGRSLRNVIGCDYGLWLFSLGVFLQPLQVAIGAVTGTSVCLRILARPDASPAGRD